MTLRLGPFRFYMTEETQGWKFNDAPRGKTGIIFLSHCVTDGNFQHEAWMETPTRTSKNWCSRKDDCIFMRVATAYPGNSGIHFDLDVGVEIIDDDADTDDDCGYLESTAIVASIGEKSIEAKKRKLNPGSVPTGPQ